VTHGRKYGEKDSHPIPLWNGVFEHYDRIRDALWEFLWCIDAITKEKDGIGLVLGGSPVKLKRIVADLKADKETVRRHLKNLAAENYIRVRRTPYGQIIEVLNSKKFGIWRKEKPQNTVSPPIEKPIHESEKPIHEHEKPQNAVSKEDSAGTQQEDSAVRDACPVWTETGVAANSVPGPFRKLCEDLWPTRSGTIFEFMGFVLDAWHALGSDRYPPVWVKRKTELRATAYSRPAPMQELEILPPFRESEISQ
jgi:hypothetical protein